MGTNVRDSTYSDTDLDLEETKQRRSTLATIRLGIFYLALSLAAAMTVLFLPDLLALLVMGWTADAGLALGIHRLHVMGIAAVVGAFLLGLFAQVYRPTRRVASMWGAFCSILVVSAGTVAYGVGRPEEVLPFLAVTGIALVAHPAGRGLLRRGESYSPALLALVAVAAVPLLAFAVGQWGLSAVPADSHALEGHYVMMAGLAIAPLAYGLFAALGFVGWRLAAWLAALPAAYYGLLSLGFPAQAGSAGVVWGVAAVCWAIAFVAIAEYSRRETSTAFRRHTAHSSQSSVDGTVEESS